ncbi:hypothetical protein PR048_008182 [Dryococelus australis]|uniref:Uncharacterized protein n=1 Tax=Dryococelus australis TaxID=614101 RepID=A0ABQ9HWD5_9NEOP|nr:hypothetical protein PR048_008182 [Dryococelus australis]
MGAPPMSGHFSPGKETIERGRYGRWEGVAADSSARLPPIGYLRRMSADGISPSLDVLLEQCHDDKDLARRVSSRNIIGALGLPVGILKYNRAVVGGRSSVAVRVLASHQGEPGSIPGGAGFSHVGIVADDAADQRVFSGITHFPRPFIPAPLHTHLVSPSSALKTSNFFNHFAHNRVVMNNILTAGEEKKWKANKEENTCGAPSEDIRVDTKIPEEEREESVADLYQQSTRSKCTIIVGDWGPFPGATQSVDCTSYVIAREKKREFNCDVRRDFLQDVLPEYLEEVTLDAREVMWFQQDGVPPHFAIAVRRHLDMHFPYRWKVGEAP